MKTILLCWLLPLWAFSATVTLNEDTRASFTIPLGCSSSSPSPFWVLTSSPRHGGVYKSSETSDVALPSGANSGASGLGDVVALEYRPSKDFFGGKLWCNWSLDQPISHSNSISCILACSPDLPISPPSYPSPVPSNHSRLRNLWRLQLR